MTNQELQIEVAKAMGWREVGIAESYFVHQTVVGIPPNLGYYPLKKGQQPPGTPIKYIANVPDWPNDLPACMRDLWPWLRETCTIAEVNTAGTVTVELPYQGLFDVDEGDESHSLCHAVLAVDKKLKE